MTVLVVERWDRGSRRFVCQGADGVWADQGMVHGMDEDGVRADCFGMVEAAKDAAEHPGLVVRVVDDDEPVRRSLPAYGGRLVPDHGADLVDPGASPEQRAAADMVGLLESLLGSYA